jgi:hypothetical protein
VTLEAIVEWVTIEEHPPIMATPTTARDKATWGSISHRCRVDAGGDSPKEEDKLEHSLLESGGAKLLVEDSVGGKSCCMETTAAHTDSMNSLYWLLNPVVKKLHPSSP